MSGYKSMKKVQGKKIKIKWGEKKVLAHQSSQPAVGCDISLVHFVNRGFVCREAGSVRVTRRDRDAQRQRKTYEGEEESAVPFSLEHS